MKFAATALVASASAIQIRSQAAGCVDAQLAQAMFQQIDSNHNGQINQQELEAAGRWIARAYDLEIPQTAVQWLEQ